MKTNTGDRIEYEWERQFDALNHHAIVSIADHKGTITYVNDLFCEISGFTRDELIGNNHRIVKSDEHSPEFFKNMWRTIANGNIWKGEICNKRKDGSIYWVESTITPYMDEQGKPYQYVSIRTDITHVKSVQQRLEASNSILEEITSSAQKLIVSSLNDLNEKIEFILNDVARHLKADAACVATFFDDLSYKIDALWRDVKADSPFNNFFSQSIMRRVEDTKVSYFVDDLSPSHGLGFYVVPVTNSVSSKKYIVFRIKAIDLAHLSGFDKQILVFAEVLGNAISRVAANEELIEVKERLRLGQVFANIGTWEWNIQNGNLYWSEKIAPLFGYEEGSVETSYQNFIDAVHPDDREIVQSAVDKAVHHECPYEVEHRIVKTDGTVRWLSEKGAVIRDKDNNPIKMIGVVQDIDERKSAQIELEKRESDLRRAQELAHVGNWKADFKSGRIYWSEEIYRIFGLEPYSCEPTIEFFHGCLHPDDYDLVRDREESSKKTGHYEVEHRVIRPNGDVRWVHEIAETILDEDGNFYEMNGTVQDVTDRVLASKRIRDVEQRFAFAVEGAGDGIWDWDMPTGSMVHDRLYMEMLGYEKDELPHHIETWVNSVHPDDIEDVQKTLNSYLCGDSDTYRVELRLRCKNGSYKWILCRGTVVERDSSGNPVRMIGIHSDIDDFKSIQQELIKSKEESEQANKAKSEFLSSMSHELRTPLNSILGFSQILKLDSDLLGDNVKSVDEIISSGRYLLDLISDILDLSKIESGRISLSIEPVDLKQIVLDSLSVVKPLAEGRVEIFSSLEAEVIVNADIIRLRQSIINLLSNSIKYNKPNGKVFVEAIDDGDFIILNVKDTGVGISERNLRNIFEPFNRLSYESSGIEGTGIGLSITKSLMEMMGGSVSVESTLGTGSVFSLKLPKAEFVELKKNSDLQHNFSAPSICSENKIVLYVDDNPSNIRLVKNIMGRIDGVDLIDAHSAELGIELAKREFPDLIILDINMPNMDGYQVLETLRKDELLNDVPIIALTANAMPSDIKKGLAAGFEDYLTKPLDVDAFIGKVVSFLEQKVT